MGNHVSWETVRDLAYRIWEQRGRREGREQEDWFEAERRLGGTERPDSKTVDEAVKESFPASDAPASGLPDNPPTNADEKWAAARKKRPTKRSPVRAAPDDAARKQDEVPKVASPDAPGG
jgi:DUF2934 family protein